jgi:hypothetical protein
MSSSSDEDVRAKAKKGGKKAEKHDYQIKPSTAGPSMDTSNWPLLLKVKPYIIKVNISYIEL